MTLNNYTEHEHDDIVKKLKDIAEYGVIGKEVGASGTHHLQIYCEFKNMKSMKQIKSINERMHVEPRRGTKQQASNYCKKDDDFIEIGELKNEQGKRNDLNLIKDMVKEGKNMRDIIEVASNYQAIRMAETIRKYYPPPEREKPIVYWFYGTTGSGKSKRALTMSDKNDRWISMHNLKWWEGYDGHSDVILDDIRSYDIELNYLLRLLDENEFRVEYKGGSTFINPKRIFITTDCHPENFYNNKPVGDIRQLIRRIDHIWEFRGEKCCECNRYLYVEEWCDCVCP